MTMPTPCRIWRSPRSLVALLLAGWLGGRCQAQSLGTPFEFSPGEGVRAVASVTVLGAVRLARRAPDGLPLHGLSGLAWLPRTQTLIAVTDQGELLSLRPVFAAGRLRDVTFLARHALRDAHGAPLAGRSRDAEGLALLPGQHGENSLAVSFEQFPRVERYSMDGHWLGPVKLPEALLAAVRQQPGNHGLEALARLSDGSLVAGLERAESSRSDVLRLWVSDGRHWTFPARARGGALVALDTLPDGTLLALERRYLSPLAPLIISIHRLIPGADDPTVEAIAQFSSARGWPVDNFEGLATLGEREILIVSDDNASLLQNTLLVHLRLPPSIATGAPRGWAAAAAARRP